MSPSAEIKNMIAGKRKAVAAKLKPGTWVLCDPIVTAWTYSHPSEVVRVSGNRVYLRRPRRNNEGVIEDYAEGYKSIDSVKLVASSEAIAQEIVDADRRIAGKRDAEITKVYKSHGELLKAAVADILRKEQ